MSELPAPEQWSPQGLVEHFGNVHRKMPDRHFAFVLGAGASVQSGIPAAGTLVKHWLGELHRRLAPRGIPLERWATAAALGIPGFEFARATEFYSQVFERRFRQHPDEGYADLENIMHRKDPSFGYSVLAQILAETRHKLVITTNFDNLVADALSIFTDTSSLVCGHESLAQFIRVHPRRPVVVKIHRDLLMEPMNQVREIEALRDAWKEPLTRVFRSYTPIVIGYGGNDGSLMGFLNGLPERSILGGIFWCYWAPAGPPPQSIQDLVARHSGALVPIHGFDELMLLLSAELKFTLLDRVIEEKARVRLENYRNRLTELTDLVTEQARSAVEVVEAEAAPTPASEVPLATLSASPKPAPDRAVSQGVPVPAPPADRRGAPAFEMPTRGAAHAAPPAPAVAQEPAPPEAVADDEAALEPAPMPARPGALRSPKVDALRAMYKRTGARPPARSANEVRGALASRGSPLEADTGELSENLLAWAKQLQSALQKVARETSDDSAASALARARAEPVPARALEMLRAAVARFPDDIELSRVFADRLCEESSPTAVHEALRALKAVTEYPPSLKVWWVRRDRALLQALRDETALAREELRAGLDVFEFLPEGPERIGFLLHFTLAAGLLARLDGRDDTPALATFKAIPGATMTERAPNLIAAVLERLDAADARLYRRLYQTVSGELERADLERLESRYRKVIPASPDWTGLDRLL